MFNDVELVSQVSDVALGPHVDNYSIKHIMSKQRVWLVIYNLSELGRLTYNAKIRSLIKFLLIQYSTCNVYHFVNTLYVYIWSFMINTYIPVSESLIDLQVQVHVCLTKTNYKYWYYQYIGSFEIGNLFYIA